MGRVGVGPAHQKHQKIDQHAVENVNQHVHEVIAEDVVVPKVIIQGKADIGKRATLRRALEAGAVKRVYVDPGHPDRGIVPDVRIVVEMKGPLRECEYTVRPIRYNAVTNNRWIS